MTPVWIRTSLIVTLVGLSGCTSITVSENAWTKCTLGGTALVGSLAVASGMHVLTGATLGLANAGLGCFLVFENATVRTEKVAEKERAQQEVEVPTFDGSQPAMPIIPIMPTLEDDE